MPIAKNKTRIFPSVIDELAENTATRRRLLSDRERLSYRELPRFEPLFLRAGAGAGASARRTVCLTDARTGREIISALGSASPGRRRGGADQHQCDGHGARLLHHTSSIQAIIVAAETARAVRRARAARIQGGAKFWLHGDADTNFPRLDREAEGFPARQIFRWPNAQAHNRGSGAVHLQSGNDGPAEGRQHEPNNR